MEYSYIQYILFFFRPKFSNLEERAKLRAEKREQIRARDSGDNVSKQKSHCATVINWRGWEFFGH